MDLTTQASTTFADLFKSQQQTSPYMLLALAVFIALLGMIMHWAKKYYTGQSASSLIDWFFVKNLKATFWAVVSMLGTLAATFGPLDYSTISFWQVFTQAFTIGYAADSFMNSDQS